MLHKLSQYWVVWVILLVGSFLPVALLEAHESSPPGTPGQEAKESPCPFCGQPWRGPIGLEMAIPDKLPTPKNQLWISKLRGVLGMEKHAKAQYEADQKKFGLTNPYRYSLYPANLNLSFHRPGLTVALLCSKDW